MSNELFTLPASALKARRLSNKRGHIQPPGTGPAGETCRTCRYLSRSTGHAKTYLKCWLAKAFWTGGTATDVREGDAACRRWEARPH